MQHDVTWKSRSDKEEKERLKMRKEIIKEIQDACECKDCPRIKKYFKTKVEKQEKKNGRHIESRKRVF